MTSDDAAAAYVKERNDVLLLRPGLARVVLTKPEYDAHMQAVTRQPRFTLQAFEKTWSVVALNRNDGVYEMVLRQVVHGAL